MLGARTAVYGMNSGLSQMVQHRRLILVTGAPRTATTPVGNMLARCRGVVSLYEPLGPTGLVSVSERYPSLVPVWAWNPIPLMDCSKVCGICVPAN